MKKTKKQIEGRRKREADKGEREREERVGGKGRQTRRMEGKREEMGGREKE